MLRAIVNSDTVLTDCRQDAGVAVHEDGAHAQRSSDGARVLPARTPKARQHVCCHIIPLFRACAVCNIRDAFDAGWSKQAEDASQSEEQLIAAAAAGI